MSKKLNIEANVTPSQPDLPSNIAMMSPTERREHGKAKMQKFIQEEMQMVRGVFQNFETPGMALPLQVKKYPGHFFNKILEDGQEYEVPLYIARHLNGIDATAEGINGQLGTCSYEVHSHIMDQNGNPIVVRNKRTKRFGFQSTQFSLS